MVLIAVDEEDEQKPEMKKLRSRLSRSSKMALLPVQSSNLPITQKFEIGKREFSHVQTTTARFFYF